MEGSNPAEGIAVCLHCWLCVMYSAASGVELITRSEESCRVCASKCVIQKPQQWGGLGQIWAEAPFKNNTEQIHKSTAYLTILHYRDIYSITHEPHASLGRILLRFFSTDTFIIYISEMPDLKCVKSTCLSHKTTYVALHKQFCEAPRTKIVRSPNIGHAKVITFLVLVHWMK